MIPASEVAYLAGCLGLAGETDPVKLERAAAALGGRDAHFKGETLRNVFHEVYGRYPA